MKTARVVAKNNEVTLIDVTQPPNADLSGFDRIGYASGIYYSKFHKSLLQFMDENLPYDKSVFFLYTYGHSR